MDLTNIWAKYMGINLNKRGGIWSEWMWAKHMGTNVEFGDKNL